MAGITGCGKEWTMASALLGILLLLLLLLFNGGGGGGGGGVD